MVYRGRIEGLVRQRLATAEFYLICYLYIIINIIIDVF